MAVPWAAVPPEPAQGGTGWEASRGGEGPVAFDHPSDVPERCGVAGALSRGLLRCAPPFPRRERGGVQSNAGAPAGHCPQRPARSRALSRSPAWHGLNFLGATGGPGTFPGLVVGGRGGGRKRPVQCVRLSLSSVRQVPCPQHLYLSPAHHPHACSQSWKRGVAPPTPPRNRPMLGPGAPGRTRLSYWDPPAEIPLTLPCK